jgi:hypothetical protein
MELLKKPLISFRGAPVICGRPFENIILEALAHIIASIMTCSIPYTLSPIQMMQMCLQLFLYKFAVNLYFRFILASAVSSSTYPRNLIYVLFSCQYFTCSDPDK